MRVLLAFDKFKASLTAPQACAAAAQALREVRADWTLDLCPLADGGEGFAEILTLAASGRPIAMEVTGPGDRRVRAEFGLVSTEQIPAAARARLALPPAARDGTVAVIELAQASGLARLAPADRNPWQATTFGTGELLRAAATHGAGAILLGVGGSATHDLGLGALAALGLSFRAADGREIQPMRPERWIEVDRIDGRIDGLPPVRVACDVTNPLLGPRGAAAVYGPQKGLAAADLARWENATARLALMLCARYGRPDSLMDAPGAGAAGGTAFGLMCALDARLLPGSDLVADWLDLDARIARADLVITGEGRFDASSLSGKGPGAVIARARTLGRPVHLFAGSIDMVASPPGLALHVITPPSVPQADALRDAAQYLGQSVRAAFGADGN